MSTNTEEILRKLSDKIAEIYDPEFAEEFTEIFEVLVTRTELYLYIWRLRSYTFGSQKVKPKTWRPRDVKRVI